MLALTLSRATRLNHYCAVNRAVSATRIVTRMASNDRVLYWGSGSPFAWRALVALEEKGLEFESNQVDFSKGEHKNPEVVAINPRGQVPTFKDGEAVVNESMAIIQYLEDKYPEPALMPKDDAARAKVLQRFHELYGFMTKFFLPFKMKMTGDDDEKKFNDYIEDVKKELAYWDSYLKEDEFVAGSEFSIADVAFGPLTQFAIRFGVTFKDYPNIKKYADKMKEWPSIAKTSPPHWKDSEDKDWLAGVL